MTAFNDYSGLQLWLEADSIVGLSDGDQLDLGLGTPPFTTWPESGPVEGTSDDVQSALSIVFFPDQNLPTWETDVLCGYPAVRFHRDWGTRGPKLHCFDRFSIPGTGAHTGVISYNAYTAYSLFRVNAFTLGGGGFTLFGEGNSPQWELKVTDVSGVLTLTSRKEIDLGMGSASAHEVALPVDIGRWYLAETWYDGSDLYLSVNAGSPVSSTGSPLRTNVTNSVNIGERSSLDAAWEFDLVGNVIYDEARSDPDRADIRDIWYSKYTCLNAIRRYGSVQILGIGV